MRRHGESRIHEKQKERIGAILRSYGWEVQVDSRAFECKTSHGIRTYWPDVYAQNFCFIRETGSNSMAGARRIIVEVQGFTGHKSKAAFQADKLRIQDIRAGYGSDIEYYTVHLNRRIGPLDIRSWTVDDICQHLNLK